MMKLSASFVIQVGGPCVVSNNEHTTKLYLPVCMLSRTLRSDPLPLCSTPSNTIQDGKQPSLTASTSRMDTLRKTGHHPISKMHVTFVDTLYTGPAPTGCGLQGFDKYGIDQRSATGTATLQKALGLKVNTITGTYLA